MSSFEISNNFHKIFVGNKYDLDKEVDEDKVQKLIEEYKSRYFETSAKDGKNVELILKR